jgi:FkbM family methyltransferase
MVNRFSLPAAAGGVAAPLQRVYAPMAEGANFRLVHRLADAWIAAWPFPGGPALAKAIARRVLPRLREPTVCRTSLGFDLVVSPGDGINYYCLGAYERGTLNVMSRCLRAGDTFVDVGASIGQMALHASSLVGDSGRVLAVEPQTDRFTSLIDGIALNGRRNTSAHRIALAETASSDNKLYCGRVSPSLVAGAADEGRFALVDTQRLDVLLADERVGAVRMIKIDVEGFETQVLRGSGDLLAGADAPIVCLEHGGMGADPMAAFHYLQSRNDYGFWHVRGGKDRRARLEPAPAPSKLRLGDNVFCFLDTHVRELADVGLFA